MLFGFINRVSGAGQLRQGLDASAARTRGIADRVAKASLNNGDGFALPTPASAGAQAGANGQPQQGETVDLETEMMSLGDEQLRYETTAKLLEKTYAQLRTTIRDR
jgi:flagellar basal body rod protein FlgB